MKGFLVDKLQFKGAIGALSDGIVARTARLTEGTGNAKGFKHLINQLIIELLAPIRVEDEKATLFCAIFIKCFLLSDHSLSHGCLVIENTVYAMIIPPVDIVLGFKG